jgi:ubiquinone/menaquinone biosynthesis C-methylase UbiE
MEKREYEASFKLESSYWWFRGQRDILLDFLTKLCTNRTSRILDAGCGTGKNLETVCSQISPNSIGFDVSEWAVPYLRERQLTNLICQASINEIPLPDESFDFVYSLGVIECEEVQEEKAFAELWRVTKPGGHILIIVSAYQWLLAPHDRPIHAIRRYDRAQLRSLLSTRPGRILSITHLYPILFPWIAGYRLFKRWTSTGEEMPEESDLRSLPKWLNQALYLIVQIERMILKIIPLPFGTSLLAIVEKVKS